MVPKLWVMCLIDSFVNRLHPHVASSYHPITIHLYASFLHLSRVELLIGFVKRIRFLLVL